MIKNCLIDSNIIVASLNPNDNCHKKAKQFLKNNEACIKIINDLILSEVSTLLLIRTKQTVLAKNFVKQIMADNFHNYRLNQLNHKILLGTSQIFVQQSSNNLSFADSSLIAQAQITNIKNIATFDKDLRHEFKKKFTFWPK